MGEGCEDGACVNLCGGVVCADGEAIKEGEVAAWKNPLFAAVVAAKDVGALVDSREDAPAEC